jgi:hypothetical protein
MRDICSRKVNGLSLAPARSGPVEPSVLRGYGVVLEVHLREIMRQADRTGADVIAIHPRHPTFRLRTERTLIPTSRLELRLGRHAWRDEPENPLEDRIPRIVGGAFAMIEQNRIDEGHGHDYESLAEVQRRLVLDRPTQTELELAEDAKRLEIARLEQLLDDTDRWCLAQRIRSYIEAAARQTPTPPMEIGGPDWHAGATRIANGLDPLCLAVVLSEQHLHVIVLHAIRPMRCGLRRTEGVPLGAGVPAPYSDGACAGWPSSC